MFKRMIEMLTIELWVQEMAETAIDLLAWAIEHPEKSHWLAIGRDPMEGPAGVAPPQRVWRLN